MKNRFEKLSLGETVSIVKRGHSIDAKVTKISKTMFTANNVRYWRSDGNPTQNSAVFMSMARKI